MKLPFKKKNTFITNSLTLKIAGEAGFGIEQAGLIFAKTYSKGNLYIQSYSEYPSVIREGHDTFQLSISDRKIFAPYKSVNFLIALNKESVEKHLYELSDKALIMYDPSDSDFSKELGNKKNIILCPIPLAKLTKDTGADRLMRNTTALGASIAILEYDINILNDIFKKVFNAKGTDIIDLNIACAKAGYDYAKSTFNNSNYPYRLSVMDQAEKKQMVITGNEAIGMGAIKGGVKFYAGYPMSPSSSILHFMAKNQEKYNIIVKQTEDEISAANMAIGASFAGVRSMSATSGGGFSLMVESLGLAAITETPMVYVDCQRPGPATGLPTWTEQGDLKFVLSAAQGEFPRIVVAPGDASECFYSTIQVLNLAEKYQLPAIILMDKFLCESPASCNIFNDSEIKIERGKMLTQTELMSISDYKRYDLKYDSTGVSPRSIPGMKNGIFLANSDEHDEHGFSNEESDIRIEMQNKRFKKFIEASKEIPEPVLYGPQKADYTIVGWGSTKGIILEAIEILNGQGIKANFLHLLYLSPFPAVLVSRILEMSKTLILVENNMTAQLGSLISEHTGYVIGNKILKYDGRPFFPDELAQKIKSLKSRKGLSKWMT